jgi:hypothetical protein
MSKKENTARVLQASDNQVHGASEGQIAPAPTKTTYDIPAMLTQHKTKSGVIRALAAEGLKVNEIHKVLKEAGWHSDKNPGEPIRYQHVRNVLNQNLKKGSSAPAATTEANTAS